MVKNLPPVQTTQVPSLGREDPLEKEVATHSSIFAWKIPWTEEPGRLRSMGLQRVRHSWKWINLPVSLSSVSRKWLLYKLCLYRADQTTWGSQYHEWGPVLLPWWTADPKLNPGPSSVAVSTIPAFPFLINFVWSVRFLWWVSSVCAEMTVWWIVLEKIQRLSPGPVITL